MVSAIGKTLIGRCLMKTWIISTILVNHKWWNQWYTKQYTYIRLNVSMYGEIYGYAISYFCYAHSKGAL